VDKPVRRLLYVVIVETINIFVGVMAFRFMPIRFGNMILFFGTLSLIWAGTGGLLVVVDENITYKAIFVVSCFPSVVHLRFHGFLMVATVVPMVHFVTFAATGKLHDTRFSLPFLVLTSLLVIVQGFVKEQGMWKHHVTMVRKKISTAIYSDYLAVMLPQEAIRVVLSRSAGNLESQPLGRIYENCTIMFVDIVLEQVIRKLKPSQMVRELNKLFTLMDKALEETDNELYKVETISSTYVVSAGLPTEHKSHAHMVVAAAIRMRQMFRSWRWPSLPGQDRLPLDARIGAHSGQMFAGVPGLVNPRFRLFGDTMNMAARVESKAPFGTILVSPATKDLLESKLDDGDTVDRDSFWPAFSIALHGVYSLKGKGEVPLYAVDMNTQFGSREVRDSGSSLFSTGSSSVARNPFKTAESLCAMADSVSETPFRVRGEERYIPSLPFMDPVMRAVSNFEFQSRVHRTWSKLVLFCCGWRLMPRPKLTADDDLDADLDADMELDMDTNLENPLISWLSVNFVDCKLEQNYRRHRDAKLLPHVKTLSILYCSIVSVALAVNARWVDDSPLVESDDWPVSIGALVATWALVLVFALWSPQAVQRRWPEVVTGMMLLLRVAYTYGVIWRLPRFALENSDFIIWPFTLTILQLPFGMNVLFYLGNFALRAAIHLAYFSLEGGEECEAQTGVDQRLQFGTPLYCSDNGTTSPVTVQTIVNFYLMLPGVYNLYMIYGNERAARRRHAAQLLTQRRDKLLAQCAEGVLPDFLFKYQLSSLNEAVMHNFPLVCQLFSDICGFTSQVAQLPAARVFELVADLFGMYDSILSKLNLTKVDTIGDAYWAMAGRVDEEATPEDALAMVKLAFGMQVATSKVFPFGQNRPPFRIRIGLHASKCIGGLVGNTMPRYHLFGPHVALANQLETAGADDLVLASSTFADLLLKGGPLPPEMDVRRKDSTSAGGMLPSERVRWEGINAKVQELAQVAATTLGPVVTIARGGDEVIKVELSAWGQASAEQQSGIPGEAGGDQHEHWGTWHQTEQVQASLRVICIPHTVVHTALSSLDEVFTL